MCDVCLCLYLLKTKPKHDASTVRRAQLVRWASFVVYIYYLPNVPIVNKDGMLNNHKTNVCLDKTHTM